MKIDASHLQLTIILDFLQHDEFIFIMIMSLHSRETALIFMHPYWPISVFTNSLKPSGRSLSLVVACRTDTK